MHFRLGNLNVMVHSYQTLRNLLTHISKIVPMFLTYPTPSVM